MPDINKPMDIPELALKPPIIGKVRLSEDMQQTLALLCGYGDSARRLIKVAESGVLNTAAARIQDIVHVTGSGPNDIYQGGNVPTTEVLVLGHPDNTGRVWVRPDKTATVNNAYPLDAKDGVVLAIDNLQQLNLLIVVDGEKAILLYTR